MSRRFRLDVDGIEVRWLSLVHIGVTVRVAVIGIVEVAIRGGILLSGLFRSTSAARAGLVRRHHAGVQRRQITHHPFVLLLLIRVNRLRMLAKVVQTRKLLSTVAAEGTLAGVFPDMTGKVLAAAENHPTVSVPSALKGLRGCRAIALVDPGVLCV